VGIVEQEFHTGSLSPPTFTLVLGSDRDEVSIDLREVKLKKWNPELFAQAVVQLSFEELMTFTERSHLAQRALRWTQSVTTVDMSGQGQESKDK
jgi:hypothetical protein